MNLAAAAGGTAARVAVDRMAGWLSQPRQQPQRMVAQQPQYNPQPQRFRGRGGRRGRGRGRGNSRQPQQGLATRGGANITVRDTEVVGKTTGSIQVLEFNPGIPATPRLKSFEAMYRRYRIKYFSVAFKSGSGMATAGNVTLGIAVGPKMSEVKDSDTILKLRPSFYVPAWKNDSVTVGSDIDLGRYMLCGDNTADGIAFTLYVQGTADAGMIQVSYEVEFSHPRPF